jgi:hypothetical protein
VLRIGSRTHVETVLPGYGDPAIVEARPAGRRIWSAVHPGARHELETRFDGDAWTGRYNHGDGLTEPCLSLVGEPPKPVTDEADKAFGIIRSAYLTYNQGRPPTYAEYTTPGFQAVLDAGPLDADPFLDAQDFGSVVVHDVELLGNGRVRVDIENLGRRTSIWWTFDDRWRVSDLGRSPDDSLKARLQDR